MHACWARGFVEPSLYSASLRIWIQICVLYSFWNGNKNLRKHKFSVTNCWVNKMKPSLLSLLIRLTGLAQIRLRQPGQRALGGEKLSSGKLHCSTAITTNKNGLRCSQANSNQNHCNDHMQSAAWPIKPPDQRFHSLSLANAVNIEPVVIVVAKHHHASSTSPIQLYVRCRSRRITIGRVQARQVLPGHRPGGHSGHIHLHVRLHRSSTRLGVDGQGGECP